MIAAVDLPYLAALILFSLGLAATPRVVLRLWRHETESFDRCPRWWPYGHRSWKGWVRAIPVNSVGAFFLLVAGWMVPIGRSTLSDAVAVVAGCGLLICSFAFLTVMLWNRPQLVVPPNRRREPGLLRDPSR